MQSTFDRTLWNEDREQEMQRDRLDRESDPQLVRKLFPFKAKAIKRLVAYNIAEGHIFEFARPRDEMAFYPIIAMAGIAGDPTCLHPRKIYLSSDEAQLLEA